jgi:hypothetical protein
MRKFPSPWLKRLLPAEAPETDFNALLEVVVDFPRMMGYNDLMQLLFTF